MKKLVISAIMEGTVIDHIPAENTFKVAEILGLDRQANVISIASNLKSKKIGKKGIIKLEGVFLRREHVDRISIIAAEATLCVIKDYKVIEKKKLKRPDRYENIIRCFNPNCITNMEKAGTVFDVESQDPLSVRCYHCERAMDKDDIELL